MKNEDKAGVVSAPLHGAMLVAEGVQHWVVSSRGGTRRVPPPPSHGAHPAARVLSVGLDGERCRAQAQMKITNGGNRSAIACNEKVVLARGLVTSYTSPAL